MDRVDRRDVDDRAAVALRAHLRGGGLDAEERAADVDVEDALELRRRHVLEQEVREDAGVVDEHVEPAERSTAVVDEPVDVVSRPRCRPAAETTDRPSRGEALARGFEPVRAPVGEHDGGARLGEPARAREAEALRRAGDERDLAAQVEQRASGCVSRLRFRSPRAQRYKIIRAHRIGAHGDTADRLRHGVGRGRRGARALHRPGGAAVPRGARPRHDAPRRRAARPPARGARGALHVLPLRPHPAARARRVRAARRARRSSTSSSTPTATSSSATSATRPRAPSTRRCCPRRRTSRCARSSGSRRS